MSCKDKDGGTHHYACECREAYVSRLESRLSRLEGVAEKMNTALYWCRRWIAEDGGASNAQIEEALAAYDSYRKGEGKP